MLRKAIEDVEEAETTFASAFVRVRDDSEKVNFYSRVKYKVL